MVPCQQGRVDRSTGLKVIDVEWDRRVHTKVLLDKLDKGMYRT